MAKYRLLIVDDEAIERRAMRKIVTDGIAEAEIAGEAANGREAVGLADAEAPDVILMDIKMPGVDGVEAVRRIKAKHPEMKFIMVSAFDTFEYAREVMKEGVKEYLLKPGKKDEIVKTVRRVIAEVEEERAARREREALEGKLEQAIGFVRSEWVTSLLLDHVQETEAADWLDFLDLKGGVVYAVVCRLSSEEGGRDLEKRGYGWLKKELTEKLNGLVGPMFGGQIPVLVHAEKDGRQTVRARAVGAVKELLASFEREFPDFQISVGIGSEVSDVGSYSKSYDEAMTALDHTTAEVRSMVFHPSMTVGRKAEEITAAEDLLEAVHEGHLQMALRAFDKYAGVMTEDRDKAMTRLENVLYKSVKIAEEMGVLLPFEMRLNEDGRSVRELIEQSRSHILRIVKHIHQWQVENTNNLLQEARTYLDEHYREAVTLEETAEHVRLSPYYFSKLFKEQNGATFIEYLTELRMNRAKELLRTTRLSLKEICFEAGYRNPNYFSRVFKKRTGFSPSRYRVNVSPGE
ncbi:MAG TPA: response regulator [Bacillales bacterium]|nr:response regulator [Bacillales bacterium]